MPFKLNMKTRQEVSYPSLTIDYYYTLIVERPCAQESPGACLLARLLKFC